MPEITVTISIVSHRQNGLVNRLLNDIDQYCGQCAAVVITENAPDHESLLTTARNFPITVIRNSKRRGFGANHNAAFGHCHTPFYCVANPDIQLIADPFPDLMQALAIPAAGVAAPLVRSPAGRVEDSARRFPTPYLLLRKALSGSLGLDYSPNGSWQPVDWVAGMFMLFREDTFREIGGFDPAYFLYYEDIDLCARLGLIGKKCWYVTSAGIVHDARRTSRRNPIYAWWHARSIARYLGSDTYKRMRRARAKAEG
jgi:N-acetylglucosaminyl-diphospho-decaprenol L-rhamnosyltransferase